MPKQNKKWVQRHYIKVDNDIVKCSMCDKTFLQFYNNTSHFKRHIQLKHPEIFKSVLTRGPNWEKNFGRREGNTFQCFTCNKFYYMVTLNPTLETHLQEKHLIYEIAMADRIQWLNRFIHGTRCIFCNQIF